MSATIKPTTADRMLAALRALIRAEFPRLAYLGLYEYVVQAADGLTVDASPTDTTIPMPSITKIPIYTGLPGTLCTPAIGSKLVVCFLNGDPTRPTIIGAFDGNNLATFPLIFIAGGLPIQGAARVGDAVGPFLVTSGSTKTFIGG